jgi:hypothetical protein
MFETFVLLESGRLARLTSWPEAVDVVVVRFGM